MTPKCGYYTGWGGARGLSMQIPEGMFWFLENPSWSVTYEVMGVIFVAFSKGQWLWTKKNQTLIIYRESRKS